MAERGALGAIEWSPAASGSRRYGANAGFNATSGMLPPDGYRDRSRNLQLAKMLQARLAGLVGNGLMAPEQMQRMVK